MSTYDARLDALEKDAAVMKQDIIYKLDDTNSALTILKGVIGNQGQDIKDMKHRLDGMDKRFDGVDQRFDGVDRRLDGMDKRLDGIDQRLDGIDQRFTSLEEKFDQRFEQVLQVLATLTKKA